MEIGLHGNIELPVKCCKPDSARHSTINIIANRLVAVLGKRQRLAVLRLTVNQFPSGINAGGSIPLFPTCRNKNRA